MNESELETSGAENTPESLVQQAQTIDELKEVLLKIGSIEGTERTYEPVEIINYIDGVMEKKTDIHFITRKYGIRNKVRELLGLPIPKLQ